MNYTLLNRNDLHLDDDTYEFQGYPYAANVCVILVDVPTGSGPRLHVHPYEEVFIVQEGQAIYTIGATTLEVKASQVVIVPPGVPHKFINSGSGPLRQTDIHVNKQFITEWLED